MQGQGSLGVGVTTVVGGQAGAAEQEDNQNLLILSVLALQGVGSYLIDIIPVIIPVPHPPTGGPSTGSWHLTKYESLNK